MTPRRCGPGSTRSTGEDDLGAWKRLLTQLEFRDPRRSLARGPRRRTAACSADVTPRGALDVSPIRSVGGDRGDAGDEAHRGLSTARAALQVTWLLARAPDGVRADEVARDARQERLHRVQPAGQPVRRRRRRAPAGQRLPASRPRSARRSPRSPTATTSPAWSTTCSRARTSAPTWRCCAAANCASCSSAACRACRSCPGMSPEIARQRARAGARQGRAGARAPARRVERYLSAGLKRFTPDTITDPDALRDELRARPPRGVATDREEFGPDFCCLAAPLLDHAAAASSAPSASRCPAAPSTPSASARGDAPRRRGIPTICG